MNDINSILDGVCHSLDAVFNRDGDNYEIYIGDVEQGLSPPCFIVSDVSNIRRQRLGRRYDIIVSVDVAYFPKDDRSEREMNDVLFDVQEILHMIELTDGSLRLGRDISAETTDGVLHVFATYTIGVVRRAREEEYMQSINGGVKIGDGNNQYYGFNGGDNDSGGEEDDNDSEEG